MRTFAGRALGLLAVTVIGVTASDPASAFARPASGKQICVGVLVDATALGGRVDTDCASVSDGTNGVEVLDAAGHQITVCRDGIIGEIDGQPADGCATKDSTHYWSYWHRAPGSRSWTYSTEGPATYKPADDSTEGWVLQNAHSEDQPPPD